MRDLVIFGAGALGRVVSQIVSDINRQTDTWRLLGYLDDRLPDREGHDLHGLPLLGDRTWLSHHPGVAVAVAIGEPAVRCRVVQSLHQSEGHRFATLVHPSAWIGDSTAVGPGTLVYPGAMIDPDVEIGSHVIINKGGTVGHDTVIGDFVTLAPGVNVTSCCSLETGCSLGVGSNTIPHVKIGCWSFVGAGSVVTKAIGDRSVAIGAPARVVRRAKPVEGTP